MGKRRTKEPCAHSWRVVASNHPGSTYLIIAVCAHCGAQETRTNAND